MENPGKKIVEIGGNVTIGRVGNMDCSKVRQLVGGGTKFGCGAKDSMDGSCSGGKVSVSKLGGVVCRR
ncbi:hypothetical protein TIFTF001_006853 [Ficus carica]|uniref:Uncharacterized protein n=1 Tax=Ficus carica TaxID=3494 RepID=A0AA88CWG2_FICCA|nr:hypothetical protein TIFTF001_006853 [Ficus carica]